MTPEQWEEIDSLYRAARDPKTRDTILSRADPAVRGAVEVLLAREAQTQTQMAIGTGVQLGPYKIEAPIGAGGMGEVFRATDTRLHRTVAIKILPRDRVSDPYRKRRFLQEARAASALNHPNIITLYDIASEGGIDYLVMEYVSGKSLDKLIGSKGLPLAQVVDYGVQIATALTAAHAAGIVHRDIKPANVMVTADGVAKVLDFGLAKSDRPQAPAEETRTMLTQAGMVMGTLAYMSPEQARAEEVDGRTDLFAFGAVLYEMATGRRAFLKALDWTTPPAAPIPAALRPIVLKLLQADAAERYQSAPEVLADLKHLEGSTPRRRWTVPKAAWLSAAGVIAAALGIAGFLSLRPSHPAERGQWLQLTNFPDSVSQPALSPDGGMLAFVRGPDTYSAPGQVYMKLLPDGEPVRLTNDDSNKMSPVFSPNGSRIAFTVTRQDKWDTWQVPIGGQPRPWLENASGLIWMKKNALLYSELRPDSRMSIVTSAEDRGGKRDVYVPSLEDALAHRSFPSPDGKSAIVVEMKNGANGTWSPCRLVPLDGSSQGSPIGPPQARCDFAAWSPDGKWMYLSANPEGAFHTFRQRFPDGQPEQITSGPTEEEGIAMAPDGHSFVTAVAQRQSVVLLHDSSGERQVSSEGYSYEPRFTPDGKKLLYRVAKGGMPTTAIGYPSELRMTDLSTGISDALMPNMTILGQPGLGFSISRDGTEVAASVKDPDGTQRLWVAAIDRQSPPRKIPNVEGRTPYFGTGGEIFYRGTEGKQAYAFGVHQDGTGLRKLSDQPIQGLHGISPDGNWVIVKVRTKAGDAFKALPVKGGSPVPAASAEIVSWSADRRLAYISIPNASVISMEIGRTFVVPLGTDKVLPPAVDDLAKLPGVRVIDAFDAVPGPTPDVYAFSRASVQRNLYRIPLP